VKPQLEPGTPNSEVVGVRIRDGVSSSYAVLWDAFKRRAAGYSADERPSCSAARQSASTVSP